MGSGMFDGLDTLFKGIGCLLCFFIPLGMWKLVELIYWLFTSVKVEFL